MNSNAIRENWNNLLAAAPVPTDGAWGTELQIFSTTSTPCPDLLNIDNPEAVAKVARNYVEAGSRTILTNTFGANRIALRRHGLEERAREINTAGARLSMLAAGGDAVVFGSMGPSGVLLMAGDVPESELFDSFLDQAVALAEGGVAALVLETMSELEEAAIALHAARRTGLPVVACMVFDSGPDRDCTMMGIPAAEAAAFLAAEGADAVGANCGAGMASFAGICGKMREAVKLPIWIKPNAGLPEIENGRVVYRTTASEFASHVPGLVEAGASFIGGCCGTTPDFIRAVAGRLRSCPHKS